MSIFRVYVDGQIFYHPHLSKLAITEATVSEDAENIDSFTLSAPYNHPYIDFIRPMASVIQCRRDDEVVFEDQSTTNLKKGDKTPAFTGEPVREGYKFIGWSPEVAETVSGDAVYYAQ